MTPILSSEQDSAAWRREEISILFTSDQAFWHSATDVQSDCVKLFTNRSELLQYYVNDHIGIPEAA